MSTTPSPAPDWRLFAPAALLPLLFFACGWFWGPPQLGSDTATGLLAWRNFTAGGAWNTISEPSPANIAIDAEQSVTWWSPGQYVAPGLLLSAGLPLGAALLLVALLSAWSLTAGLTLLARFLGAPLAALPWVALGAAGSWHTLYPFGMFIGGEVVLIAVFPWIVLAGWSLRNRPLPLLLLLPPLLLLGSFAKHSFAIYALGLLAFLWLETLRKRPRTLRTLFACTWPLTAVGLFYAAGRIFLFQAGPSPSDPGQVHHSLATAFGFSSFAPLLAATGGGSLMGRVFMLAGLKYEDGWRLFGPALALLAILPLALSARLARGPLPFHRLAGMVTLTATAILFVLMARGGSISPEDRHFRPAGVLLLIPLAVVAAGPGRFRFLARGALGFIVVFGAASAVQRHHSLHAVAHSTAEHISLPDLPPAAQAELRRLDAIGAGTDAILYLPSPALSTFAPAPRLIVTDASGRDLAWLAAHPRFGRVSTLTLVLPTALVHDGRADGLRASFLNYAPEAWTCHSVDGWDFWQATAPPVAAR